MALVQIINIHKAFSHENILEGIHAKIDPGNRIGLVGDNGTGKTTLFKIILRLIQEDQGEIILMNDIKIAYLPQISDLDENQTILQAALEGYSDLQSIEKKLEKIHQQMEIADSKTMNKLIEQQDHLLMQYEHAGGYKFRADTEAVLHGLGFSSDQFDKPIGQLSGGQKNRVGLAKTLLRECDLFLLDEPTNFLDIECTEWLENYLKNSNQAMVIISHDRYFLNQVVDEIWEIHNAKLQIFTGNYDKYQIAKEEQYNQQQVLYERQQEEIKRQKDFIRRNIYGQKHKQAQSRRNMLEKMELLENPTQGKQIHVSIEVERPQLDRIVEIRNLGHTYGNGEPFLFQDLTFSMERSERLAIMGPNGCGKSTLLHLIIKEFPPAQGTVQIGEKVSLAFYHQEFLGLDNEKTVFDSLKEFLPLEDDVQVRKLLASMLFIGDEIYKRVEHLSGGEKSRLSLLRLLVKKPNFLVLDEPTNHLDIKSRQALETALNNYDGTLLFVSHDRYFIDQVATRLLHFHNKKWISFYGNYTDFQTSKEYIIPKEDPETKKKRDAHEKATFTRSVKKPNINDLEKKIMKLEEKIAHINKQWEEEDIYQDIEKVKQLTQQQQELQKDYEESMSLWEELIS